jgi:hypothetical protein
MNCQDGDGNTILHILLLDTIQQKYDSIVQFLIDECNADYQNIKNKKGQTAWDIGVHEWNKASMAWDIGVQERTKASSRCKEQYYYRRKLYHILQQKRRQQMYPIILLLHT